MQLIGYNMIRADHPSNAKRGVICIFYKETLGVHVVNLSNLSECIICEVSIQNNKGDIGVVDRSPSQGAIEFQNFLSNFEAILSNTTTNNALFTIILGDLKPGGLMAKPQPKARNSNSLQLCMGFIHSYHNPRI